MLLGTKKENKGKFCVIVFFLSKYDFRWLESYNFRILAKRILSFSQHLEIKKNK